MNEVQNEYTLVGYRRLRFPDAEGKMIEGTQVMVIDSKEDTEDSISYPIKYWFPGLKTFADLKKAKYAFGQNVTITFEVRGMKLKPRDIM